MTLTRDMVAAGDFSLVRAALVRELGGDLAAAGLALVLTRISWRIDKLPAGSTWWRGAAWQIAEETGLSEDQVFRMISRLRKQGYLETTQEHLEGKWDKTLSYRIVWADPSADVRSPSAESRNDTADVRDLHSADVREDPSADLRNLPVLLDIEELKTKDSTSTPSVATATIDPFDEFWMAYPRKVGKADARKKFAAACKTADPRMIIAAAQRFRDDPNREDEFTAHPATWLNQGRWEDDPLPARGGHSNGNGHRQLGTTDQRVAAYLDVARNGSSEPPLSARQIAEQLQAEWAAQDNHMLGAGS